jgi:hypothetical protein
MIDEPLGQEQFKPVRSPVDTVRVQTMLIAPSPTIASGLRYPFEPPLLLSSIATTPSRWDKPRSAPRSYPRVKIRSVAVVQSNVIPL